MEKVYEKLGVANSPMFFANLVRQNRDTLWNTNQVIPFEYVNYKIIDVFDYSEVHGGTVDSFKYYDNYVVLVK